jgi:hypothetical protein
MMSLKYEPIMVYKDEIKANKEILKMKNILSGKELMTLFSRLIGCF